MSAPPGPRWFRRKLDPLAVAVARAAGDLRLKLDPAFRRATKRQDGAEASERRDCGGHRD
jgi:hypothetical protein